MVNLRLLAIKAFSVMRRYSAVEAIRMIGLYLRPRREDNQFDAMYGTDTGGLLPLWRFQIDSSNAKFGTRYETTDARELGVVISYIKEDPQLTDFDVGKLSFIDIGCGKGRMLMAALELGFQNAVGVEFVRELADIAKRNLRAVGALNATIVTTDASEYSFPDVDFVIYLFNPFSEQVMRIVLENLRRAQSNKCFVIYRNATCAALLDSSGFLRRVSAIAGTKYPTIVWMAVK